MSNSPLQPAIVTLAAPPPSATTHKMTPSEEALYHKWDVVNNVVCTLGSMLYAAYSNGGSEITPSVTTAMQTAYTGILDVNKQIVAILTGLQNGTAPNIPLPPATLPPIDASNPKLASVLALLDNVMHDVLGVLPTGTEGSSVAMLRDTLALVITAVSDMEKALSAS